MPRLELRVAARLNPWLRRAASLCLPVDRQFDACGSSLPAMMPEDGVSDQRQRPCQQNPEHHGGARPELVRELCLSFPLTDISFGNERVRGQLPPRATLLLPHQSSARTDRAGR